MLDQDETDIAIPEPIVEKPSLADRILRDQSARSRRKVVKQIKATHRNKEEKEARERLRAKRRMEKQKKRSMRG